MRICILETDRPDAGFAAQHGTYADMFRDWLAPAMPEAVFTVHDVTAPGPLPDPAGHDGFLVTGSRAGVYDRLAWMGPLVALLHDLRDRQVPVTGVCFGHQIMAAAYGGQVEKSAAGWVIGRHDHRPTPAGAALWGAEPFASISFHQDQVVAPPPGAEVLAANALSPYGGLAYPFPALSVQFHPEFLPAHVTDTFDGPDGSMVPPAIAAEARASLPGALDGPRIAAGFARFYRSQARARFRQAAPLTQAG
ncbi:type 1 glutamine amidotransferase [Frigidibacter albus]|uniref:Type 1 glutamine amidotransferase n=1 Tax=Frigidibacter albus TaxID=1465486 RepID=A0A6L8VGP4_9RHOB|nr:type 1 glutamine amidotransferase [Frigidibacter albus]MZQ88489.1 type 1 glutamine amidotransferase [Frigidibacter albus]NBE30702.1 type 1 glutamine amidotransferase [Frigidibacter albus]GGH48628.1 GMP synthase [Frigidibacter albus]